MDINIRGEGVNEVKQRHPYINRITSTNLKKIIFQIELEMIFSLRHNAELISA